MSKQQNLELSGKVTEELGNSMFRVYLETSKTEIICTISGKIRMNYIRIMSGDDVIVEVSPYDLTKGRIIRRCTEMKTINPSINNNKQKRKK